MWKRDVYSELMSLTEAGFGTGDDVTNSGCSATTSRTKSTVIARTEGWKMTVRGLTDPGVRVRVYGFGLTAWVVCTRVESMEVIIAAFPCYSGFTRLLRSRKHAS